MKKDLEMFKMNKVQMNNINGGRVYDCHVSGVEYGKSAFDVKIEANSALEAEGKANKTYGDYYYVFCR